MNPPNQQPETAETINNRGEAKRKQGALEDYNRAIELKPTLASAYNNRGFVKRDKKDLNGALADFNKAIELKPDLTAAYNNRGLVKQTNGDSSHTFAFIIDRIALINPDHPILVIDLQNKPNRTFRVILSALWVVENNLAIANMDFEEFANAVDNDGIYRGL
ncbi:MAG TPA: tetratricopeptide repeat protein [Verrucomicrobiae bacterium]|jgi:tetratricopeptide (TPR) repeat protein